MCMRISDSLLRQIESDLGLNIRYIKGQGDIPVRNCWHFSTDGNAVDVMFWDGEDYRDGMNRIAVLVPSYKVIILAFALMDNHIHFVLYGDKPECDRFMHEYVRRTSMHIANRHGESHKLSNLPIDYQLVDTDYYLKVVICYVLKNATMAGKPFLPTDYPWSSGPLMFRTARTWCAPCWIEPDGVRRESFGTADTRAFLKTRDSSNHDWLLAKDIVFPANMSPTNWPRGPSDPTNRSYTSWDCPKRARSTQGADGFPTCQSQTAKCVSTSRKSAKSFSA